MTGLAAQLKAVDGLDGHLELLWKVHEIVNRISCDSISCDNISCALSCGPSITVQGAHLEHELS